MKIPIANCSMENKNMLILKKELINVICANIIKTIKASILKILEDLKIINKGNYIDIHVKDQILLPAKIQKNKLNLLQKGPYKVSKKLDKKYINIAIHKNNPLTIIWRRLVSIYKNNAKCYHENPI